MENPRVSVNLASLRLDATGVYRQLSTLAGFRSTEEGGRFSIPEAIALAS